MKQTETGMPNNLCQFNPDLLSYVIPKSQDVPKNLVPKILNFLNSTNIDSLFPEKNIFVLVGLETKAKAAYGWMDQARVVEDIKMRSLEKSRSLKHC